MTLYLDSSPAGDTSTSGRKRRNDDLVSQTGGKFEGVLYNDICGLLQAVSTGYAAILWKFAMLLNRTRLHLHLGYETCLEHGGM